jgi:AmmeMemoRadiSam system protein B/AmmeMemoRadiSam system protein A
MIRPPAGAGTFYPAEPEILRRSLEEFMDAAENPSRRESIKALVVPHAGYVYSGSVAGSAYARLKQDAGVIERVVLLGPVHRVPVRGLALPDTDSFATPLGNVPLDRDVIARIAAIPQVVINGAAHAHEHALEVQLPFLQSVFGQFKLVPLAVGDATSAEVAEVLEALWGGPETLIVISSDLSHYLTYAEASRRDSDTLRRILAGDQLTSHEQACGATPINGLTIAARRHGLAPHLVAACNSGDTAGDRSRVVGYAAIEYVETREPAGQEDERGGVLLNIARASISSALGRPVSADSSAPWLREPGATFVTLTQAGQLRGCIGSLEARRALLEDVSANARSAALDDPRFAPLTLAELDVTRIEASLLSPLEPLAFTSEADALARLRPGVDGVVIEAGRHRATFLPQVWDNLPHPSDFIGQLKLKAGLPRHFWSNDLRLHTYWVSKWSEPENRPAVH